VLIDCNGNQLPTYWVAGLAFRKARFRVCSLEDCRFLEVLDFRTSLVPAVRWEGLGKRALKRLRTELAVDALLETLIADWDGVEIDGQPVPYKNARPAMIADGLLRASVMGAGARVDSDSAPGYIALGVA